MGSGAGQGHGETGMAAGGGDGDEERASDLGSLAAGATSEGGEGGVKFSQVLVI